MAKDLVVCCDGTWNDPRDRTNVSSIFARIVRSLSSRRVLEAEPDLTPRVVSGTWPNGRKCVAFYASGVGTDGSRARRLLAGAFGLGLGAKVREAYAFLVQHYARGDRIFLFGFSRGAFTVRSLAGMIRAAGILAKPQSGGLERAVALAFDCYRVPPEKRSESGRCLLAVPRTSDVPIHFLGVFDTVGSLGVPAGFGDLLRWWGTERFRFHDQRLGRNVRYAVQALAIHERRGSFKPVVWSDAHPGSRVHQVWFAGAHADVGGGYPDRSLADLTLRWMLDRAIEAGLPMPVDMARRGLEPNPFGPRHQSTTWFWRLLEGDTTPVLAAFVPRLPVIGPILVGIGALVRVLGPKPYVRPLVGEQHADDGSWSVPVRLAIHESVLERYGRALPAPLREALDAGLPVWRERAEPRSPASERAVFNGLPVQLVDFSDSGAGIAGANLPEPGTEGRLVSGSIGSRAMQVVWRRDGRAGLRRVA